MEPSQEGASVPAAAVGGGAGPSRLVRRGSSQARRAPIACHPCRQKRSRCDGDKPCGSCKQSGTECTYSHTGRRIWIAQRWARARTTDDTCPLIYSATTFGCWMTRTSCSGDAMRYRRSSSVRADRLLSRIEPSSRRTQGCLCQVRQRRICRRPRVVRRGLKPKPKLRPMRSRRRRGDFWWMRGAFPVSLPTCVQS